MSDKQTTRRWPSDGEMVRWYERVMFCGKGLGRLVPHLVVEVVDERAELHPEHRGEGDERVTEDDAEEEEVDGTDAQHVRRERHLGHERRGELDHLPRDHGVVRRGGRRWGRSGASRGTLSSCTDVLNER
jgi:hypothetical protein